MSKPTSKNTNKYLTLLEKHLNSLEGKPTLKNVASYLGITEKGLKKHFPIPPKPFSIKLIRQLCLGFRIPHKKFILTEKELINFSKTSKKPLKSKSLLYLDESNLMTTQWSTTPNDISDFYHLAYGTRMNPTEKSKFLENYPTTIKKYIQNIKYHNFGVYEYLGKGNKITPQYLELYSQAHEGIFEAIEKSLSSPQSKKMMKYSRYIALPYGKVSSAKLSSFDDCAIEVIKICSLPLFKHICRCLLNFNTKGNGKSVRFYIVANPWRPYHTGFMVGEDKNYVFSEYSRYSEDAGLLPDLLFIESSISDKSTYLFDLYREEMINFSHPPKYKNWYFKSIEQLNTLTKKAKKAINNTNEDVRKKVIKTMDEKLEIIENLSSI